MSTPSSKEGLRYQRGHGAPDGGRSTTCMETEGGTVSLYRRVVQW